MPDALPDLAGLLPSWQLSLQAENKAKSTVDGYGWSVHVFLKWCAENGVPPVLDKPTVQQFLVSIQNAGAQPATARTRYAALRRFSAWLADEGELPTHVLADLKPPKLATKVVNALSDEQLKALLKACQGKDFLEIRDMALVRFAAETGARANEILGLGVDDVDLKRGIAVLRRTKGSKERIVPFGPQTASALDRYLRQRRGHKLAGTTAFWLGGGGQTLGYHGLDIALKKRAAVAGIEGFHLHLMRSTAATRWLAAGGSEQGLMSVAGWSTRSMLDRYTSASASDRAASEARTLNLGDI